MTTITALGGPVVVLEDFIIDSKFRGQGLGKLLFAEVLKSAQTSDCLRVILHTDRFWMLSGI